jgi:glycosyltransferase involved in cell wall biosynthesis
VRISVVVPCRNSEQYIQETLQSLHKALSVNDEIITVVNGSNDNTLEIINTTKSLLIDGPTIVACESSQGLGAAYQEGVKQARGKFIVLTADDLPFGISDWISAAKAETPSGLIIGSKAHPDSDVQRSFLRNLLTSVFKVLRKVLLKTSVGDSQGTFFLQGDWVKSFGDEQAVSDYMWTTYLVSYAEVIGIKPIEVPVKLVETHNNHGSRVTIKDLFESVYSLIKLKRKIKIWKAKLNKINPEDFVCETFPKPNLEHQ